MPENIERTFSDQLWAVANDFGSVKAAIREARSMALRIEREADPESTVHYQATAWLDRYGREGT
jgi:hypothetical protein